MDLVKGIFSLIAGIVGAIIGAIPLPDSFVNAVDGAFAWLIGIITAASWFLPVDILLVCLGAIWVVDNYLLIFHIIKWIIGFIRG